MQGEGQFVAACTTCHSQRLSSSLCNPECIVLMHCPLFGAYTSGGKVVFSAHTHTLVFCLVLPPARHPKFLSGQLLTFWPSDPPFRHPQTRNTTPTISCPLPCPSKDLSPPTPRPLTSLGLLVEPSTPSLPPLFPRG